MDYLKIALPGSLLFFFVLLLLTCPLIFSRKFKKAGIILVLTNSFFYFLMSFPIFSELISRPLVLNKNVTWHSNKNEKIQAIVLLDGGTQRYFIPPNTYFERPNNIALLRALHAIDVYKNLSSHPLIIISGGDSNLIATGFGSDASALRSLLIQNNIPPRDIILDSDSPNTHSHALTMYRMMKEYRIKRFILVSSPSHMRRAIASFNNAGLYPIASPSQSTIDEFKGWKIFIPSYKSLEYTEEVMHEYFGLIYYIIKGWV